VGFVLDKMALGQGFPRELQFLLPILIPLHIHASSGTGTVGQVMAGALEVAQSNSNPRIKMKYTSVLKFLYI
jgi:hypothetical protein